jgi:hypothetical protein
MWRGFKGWLTALWSSNSKLSALSRTGKLVGKVGGWVGWALVAVDVFDAVKNWVSGTSSTDDRAKESTARIMFDPIILIALASVHRQRMIQDMLAFRAAWYLSQGNAQFTLFGSVLATCSEYIQHVDGPSSYYYDAATIKKICKKFQGSEIVEVVDLKSVDEFMDVEDVEDLPSFKLMDLAAYYVERNAEMFQMLEASSEASKDEKKTAK